MPSDHTAPKCACPTPCDLQCDCECHVANVRLCRDCGCDGPVVNGVFCGMGCTCECHEGCTCERYASFRCHVVDHDPPRVAEDEERTVAAGEGIL